MVDFLRIFCGFQKHYIRRKIHLVSVVSYSVELLEFLFFPGNELNDDQRANAYAAILDGNETFGFNSIDTQLEVSAEGFEPFGLHSIDIQTENSVEVFKTFGLHSIDTHPEISADGSEAFGLNSIDI